MSKTPQFDKILAEILDNIQPHSKTCKQCSVSFDIFIEDIEMYKKLQVPPPTLCPDCRMQKRFGFYNNILKFHKKECSAHAGENVISTFHPESPYKIFDLKHWWSDKWGGEDYGRDYEFNKPFFEQFKELILNVPQPAITHYWKNVIDSPYTISIIDSKNCYFSSVGAYLENSHFMYWAGSSRDSMDCLNSQDLENCYENIYSDKMFDCKFCDDSTECISSVFLRSCKNCQNCFGCVNLRNKSYCFFNEQFSKDGYLQKIKEINLGDRNVLTEYKNKFKEFLKNIIRRNLQSDRKNINSIGDNLEKAKNCFMVFRGSGLTNGIENLRYCQDVFDCKDSADIHIVGPNLSLCYELVEAYEGSNIKFSYFIKNGLNVEYCLACHNCQNCFSCIGLRNKKFHIFNKPYSEEEYWQVLDKVKSEMLKVGEYGEFFPLTMALHAYNDTYASIEFPLTDEEIKKRGWIYNNNEKEADLSNIKIIKAQDVPKDIKDVDDSILQKAIICEKTGKPFKIIKAELDFYRKHNLPIPIIHPNERILARLRERNPSRLWKMNCKKCNNEMFTAYPSEKQKEYKIYCEECYIREVV